MPTWSTNGRQQEEMVDNANSWIATTNGASTSNVVLTGPTPAAGSTAVLTMVIVTAAHVTATVESLFKVTGLTTNGGSTGEMDYQFVQSATLGGQLVINLTNPLPANATATPLVATLTGITGGGTAYITMAGFFRT